MKRLTILFIALLLLPALFVAAQEGENGEEQEKSKMNAGTFRGLSFRNIGPAFMSGRISDIAIHPNDRGTWYITIASGNVFKTTNAGTTWSPIFENYGSYSIGCVTIDPNNPNIVWIGTGENNSQRSVGYGDGVYKSIDGGLSFKHMGLKESEHIGNIVVHPEDSNTVYVAAQGPLWNEGGDRGLYKTTDGGESWEKVLDIDEHTGVNEVHMDPRDPDVLYASTYQRRRHVWVLINGGPGSAIHKTTDGGKTWRKITRGLPGMDMGKIGMDISPQNPDVLYAIVESHPDMEGFYRSENAGESWQKMSGYVSGSPQYYNEIFCDPHRFDRVYSMDTFLMATDDGGKNWYRVGESFKHVDNHAIAFDPHDPDYFIVGCDGGLYETWDRGANYKYHANLPITQYYKLAVDYDEPFYNVYGGTQDNATHGGPSQTDNIHGIRNMDWYTTVFGDGFEPAVDPENPDIVYSQWQYGGLIRFDRKSGEAIDIRPQEEPGEDPNVWNWDAALLISPHDNERLYYGSQRLWRSDDRGDSWKRISDDLTRTEVDRNRLEVMGRVWGVDAVAKNNSTSVFGNIVSLDESPLVDGLIYVGTDDGLIQVTEDGGENWTRYGSFGDVPDMTYVNDIEADLFDENTVYAAFNNHKKGDFKPYLLKSTDRGKTWTSISGDLPERGSVYALKQDHVNADLLFAGTEFGIYFTLDGGNKWIELSGGMPTIAVRDVELQRRENDVVLATFGRSFYILDNYSPLRNVNEETLAKEFHLFPVEDADLYVPKRPWSISDKAFQGAAFYTADNPPFGAVITYYMADSLTTMQQDRRKEEAKIRKEGGDVFYPSWEDLKKEDREERPAIVFTITDADGEVVRRFTGPASAGFHRVAWDLTYPSTYPSAGRFAPEGPLVVPGTYTVTAMKWHKGEFTALEGEQQIKVVPLTEYALEPQDRKESLAFKEEVAELLRVISAASQAASDAADRMEAIRTALEDTPAATPELMSKAHSMQLRLMDLREELTGDPTKPRRSELREQSIQDRLQTAWRGTFGQTYGPTGTHRRQLEIAREQFELFLPKLRGFIEVDLPAIEAELEAIGAPYTPGRKLPELK